jgi:hypothetical protein
VRGGIACLVGALALLAPAAAVTARAQPSLAVTRYAPLTVAGANFAPGERVVVTVVARNVKRARPVHAGSRGGFRIRFDLNTRLGCGNPLAVSARGASGSTATARMPRPQCPADGAPPPG